MKRLFFLKLLIIILHLSAYPQVDQNDTLFKEAEIRTFEKSGNIFVAFPDGTERQLTFTQKDEHPSLVKSKYQVIFIRNEKIDKGGVEYTRKKIMKVGINTYIEETITEQKTYKDGLENTYEIRHIENVSLSGDENFLFFITEHTETSKILIKLDLQNGKWNELFSAETFELFNSGPFENCFLIGRSETDTKGQRIYYYLVDETGKKLKEFDSKDSMQQFKNSIK